MGNSLISNRAVTISIEKPWFMRTIVFSFKNKFSPNLSILYVSFFTYKIILYYYTHTSTHSNLNIDFTDKLIKRDIHWIELQHSACIQFQTMVKFLRFFNLLTRRSISRLVEEISQPVTHASFWITQKLVLFAIICTNVWNRLILYNI